MEKQLTTFTWGCGVLWDHQLKYRRAIPYIHIRCEFWLLVAGVFENSLTQKSSLLPREHDLSGNDMMVGIICQNRRLRIKPNNYCSERGWLRKLPYLTDACRWPKEGLNPAFDVTPTFTTEIHHHHPSAVMSTRATTTTSLHGVSQGYESFDDHIGIPDLNKTAITHIVVTHDPGQYIRSLTVCTQPKHRTT